MTAQAKGRTGAGRKARSAPVKCYCGGSALAAGHSMSAKHREAARAAGNPFETTGPVTRGLPTVLRDPYGRNRDYEAEHREYVREHREYVRERHAEEAAERLFLLRTTLPDPPVTSTIAGVDYITLAEAARRLGVKPDTLLKAVHRNRMNARKVGRDWLVEESEVAWYELRSLGKVGYPKGRPRKTRAA